MHDEDQDHLERERKWRPLLILPPLLVGVASLVLLVQARGAPERELRDELRHRVAVIEVPAVAVRPRAVGYGTAQPARVWTGVAQVSGRITETHPKLERGAFIPEGAVLVRIDPTDYQLAEAAAQADIAQLEAQLAELEVREENTRRSLDIERRRLALSRRELERKRKLRERGMISESEVDQEERRFLEHRQSVQALENELDLVPSERRRIEAERERARVRVEQAHRDLEHTAIRAPFDCRIAEVEIETAQFVSAGETLVVADGIAAAEVFAQVPLASFRNVLPPGLEFGGMTPETTWELPARLGLSARLRLRSGDFAAEWQGRFDRVSTLDPETRTVGVVVVVERPYAGARPPERPPLVKNMFVEVEIGGRPQAQTVVLPRASVHEGRVYVVGADERLEIREVAIGFSQGDFVTIRRGVEAGERVLVSDPVPAVAGMRLDPVVDEAAASRLLTQTRGDETSP